MKIRVLGCHGSQLPHHNITGFLVDKNVLIDAGTVTQALTLEEQMRIDYIFVTHAHLDHIRDIAFLADNLYYGQRKEPLVICSSANVIESLKRHIFNNTIWPDFSRIPSAKAPVVKFETLSPGRTRQMGGFSIKAIALNHTVETMGFILQKGSKAVLFLGDTGPTDRVWKIAKTLKEIKAIFVETSLPGAMQSIAEKTGHLTPVSLAAELAKLKGAKPEIYLYHIKPRYAEDIRREVAAIPNRSIHIVEDGQVIRI